MNLSMLPGAAMAIEFTCPKCGNKFRVKTELAGRVAKCGCGSKLRIPQPKPVPATAPDPLLSDLNAELGSIPSSDASAASDDRTSSWLDEELESEPPAKVQRTAGNCSSCGATLMEGAVLCVECGFDTRSGQKHVLQQGDEDLERGAAAKKRKKAGFTMSLMRGSLFSFIGAMLGAIIWAVVTLMTEYEFGIIAWALGGMAGAGMAIGHEDDDGTFAGVIAAFMSIFGIISAKIFIAILFMVYFMSQMAGMMDGAVADPDTPKGKRQILVMTLTTEKMANLGEDVEWDDIETLNEQARMEVEAMSDEEITTKWDELQDASFEDEGFPVDEPIEEPLEEIADEDLNELDFAAGDGELVMDDIEDFDGGGGFWDAFGMLFTPMDGLFILLAFGTAYRIGSGKMTD